MKIEDKAMGIPFSGPMVLATLADLKTNTRRLNKQWLKVRKGDRLWVRETWRQPFAKSKFSNGCIYLADGPDYLSPANQKHQWGRHMKGWKPSIFMPRWAARIYLEATADARLEKLQEISEEDAIKESFVGQEPYYVDVYQTTDSYPVAQFACYWDSLNPKAPWKDNPEVVVLAFRRKIG